MHLRLLFASSLALAAVLPAQRLITTRLGTTIGGYTGQSVGNAGDIDGDGTADFMVGTPGVGQGLVQLFSGRTRTLLRSFTGMVGNNIGGYRILPLGDLDNDGVGDLVMPSGNLQAYSGATGALLWQAGSPLSYGSSVCDAGDVDGDGRRDLACTVYLNNNRYIWILSGRTGAQLQQLAAPLQQSPIELCSLGDIDGNGSTEFVVLAQRSLTVLSAMPLRILRTITTANMDNRHVEAADMDGDGHNDLVVGDNSAIDIFSARTGVLLRTLHDPIGDISNFPTRNFTMIGDSNRDGVPDLARYNGAVDVARGVPNPRIMLVSGVDGSAFGAWSSSSAFGFQDPELADVGDVDGDGYDDLLIGDTGVGGSFIDHFGGWQLVSGKVLAMARSIPVQCGGGPFLPQLGITRPVLGQTLTLVGRDCPPQAVGTVILSQLPAQVRNLGVSGCDAYFDFGTWIAFYTPPMGSSWQLSLPLPNLPQLAGYGLALQMIYGPTNSPIGMDLSNAIWTRLGY